MTRRRTACIILTAKTGDVRSAKAVFNRVARQVLGDKYQGDPWGCGYWRPADMDDPKASPRWMLEVNDVEYAALVSAFGPAYAAAGWTGVPLDCYHD